MWGCVRASCVGARLCVCMCARVCVSLGAWFKAGIYCSRHAAALLQMSAQYACQGPFVPVFTPVLVASPALHAPWGSAPGSVSAH
eukprot:scaffold37896_cov21-Tisochrysis_lutea.AAC.1